MKGTGEFYQEGSSQPPQPSDDESVRALRFLSAARLYELGDLSLGKAAEMADMSRGAFLHALAWIGLSTASHRDNGHDSDNCVA